MATLVSYPSYRKAFFGNREYTTQHLAIIGDLDDGSAKFVEQFRARRFLHRGISISENVFSSVVCHHLAPGRHFQCQSTLRRKLVMPVITSRNCGGLPPLTKTLESAIA